LTLVSRAEFLRRTAALAGLALVPEIAAACGSGEKSVLDRATRFEIHPTIGIARVGNSVDAFHFGPEVPGTLPHAPAGFKDGTGAIAKQAARFRVYAYGPHGEVLGEVPAGSRIDWSVSVANKKASWYDYFTAMDLSIARSVPRRNAGISGAERESLAAAVQKAISGRAARPVTLRGPVVFGNELELGELLTDEQGRLVFLPGDGRAYHRPDAKIVSFSDNDGWADNVCDGPVSAVVHVGGRAVSAASAYVLVTPPNYGPAIAEGPVTALDQVRSPLTEAGMLPRQPVGFASDIQPLLERLVDMQWVNKGFFELTRPGGQMDWLASGNLERLADPSSSSAEYRKSVAGLFRNPASSRSTVEQQPLYIGDGGVTIPPQNQHSWLPVTPLQYEQLKAWARGEFAPGEPPPRVTSIGQLPVAQQPRALDEAGLASVLGGANHPGVEAPWVLRVPTMWESAYRLRIQSQTIEIRDYGPLLTPKVAMGPTGPVHGVTPGDLTMWMGVPWHADAASCRDGYRRPNYKPPVSTYLPSYWPARVPNEVLTEDDYRVVVDTNRGLAERTHAFQTRRTWIRPVAHIPVPTVQFRKFIEEWAKFGVVVLMPGAGDGRFPRTLKVETGVGYREPTPSAETEYPCRTMVGITCPIVW
jgi:L-Lysine epsilon oxidase N-terminal/L-lysine epsilon oxidase C-terminal domain